MAPNKPHWVDYVSTESFSKYSSIIEVASDAILKASITGAIPGAIVALKRDGTPIKSIKEICTFLGESGRVHSLTNLSPTFDKVDATASSVGAFFIYPEGYVSVFGTYKTVSISFRMLVVPDSNASRIHDFISAHVDSSKKNKGNVFSLVSSQEGAGFDLLSMGTAYSPLKEENYEESVLEDYKHVAADIKAKEPCGRLILLNGPPGTGKTYLIRALLNESNNLKFLFVAPSLVPQLSGPSFIRVLKEASENSYIENPNDHHDDGMIENDSSGIVLVIEDADEVLVARSQGDTNAISACLNLSDGLVGELLNIRVLATTNARAIDIDKAILRSGRLCKRLDVKPLKPQHAQRVYKNLTGKDIVFDKDTSLADVYGIAKDHLKTTGNDNAPVGFNTGT